MSTYKTTTLLSLLTMSILTTSHFACAEITVQQSSDTIAERIRQDSVSTPRVFTEADLPASSVSLSQGQTATDAPPTIKARLPKPSYRNFADWKADFASRAVAQGYDARAVSRLLDNAQLNQQVISLDGKQPEFAKMPWSYADSAVSSGRVTNGKRNYAKQRHLLTQLESQYGVTSEIIAAIWGMESAYGAVTGTSNLPSALASLAYDGRRQDFAESQLLALLQLLQRGDVRWQAMSGSWAGGMGHTQFIPATWLEQGVDRDGDGRRNPWATADALTSTANYLSKSGWVRGLASYYEGRLPERFDYTHVNSKKTYSQWQALGINLYDQTGLSNSTLLQLWLPAGKDGPALLLSQNFDVIKVYNNSSSYALGVSLLANAIAGKTGLRASWPRYERPLSASQVTLLQQRLTNAGYDTQGIDGVLGSNTRRAFQRWQAGNGQTPDGFVSQRSTRAILR